MIIYTKVCSNFIPIISDYSQVAQVTGMSDQDILDGVGNEVVYFFGE